jgi:hypothetical protein
MLQLQGFEQLDIEHLICKIKKSLYGLKQGPWYWYFKIHSCLQREIEMIRSNSNYSLYYIYRMEN